MEDQHEHIATLERALAEAEATLQMQRIAHLEFVSLLTHELRVPMTSIKGYTDLLLKGIMGPINDPQANFLGTIRANIERMSRMVADLSDINKANGEALRLSVEGVELEPLLQEVVTALSSLAEEKGHIIRVEIAEPLPPINGDRSRLSFVFQRLLQNAIQYTPIGGTITVDACLVRDTGTVRASVQDTGIGIPQDEQQQIGDMFFRASDEKTRETTGNGLSLHLCRQLLALQGAALHFESSQGVGSTFYVTLPVHAVASQP
jgi:signal transduction histidine kinase